MGRDRLLQLLELCEATSQEETKPSCRGYTKIQEGRPPGTSLKFCVWRRYEQLVVAVRGTRGNTAMATKQNVAIDLSHTRIQPRDFITEEVEVHSGFWYAAMLIQRELKLDNYERLIFTGFSLGGAVATILSAIHTEAELVSFASPRVGDKNFSRYVWRNVSPAIRVALKGDIVTTTPPRIAGWVHAGDLIALRGKSIFEPEHKLKQYRRSISEEL